MDNRNHRPAPTVMLQGTASDVGKSLLAAALCRILKQDGWRVAPFKSQNMSNNSYVTWDGKEIGRAQGMQADACGVPATTDMNPILLKPSGAMKSQVVVHGVPLRDYEARAYREHFLVEAEPIVRDAIGRLRASFDAVVLEGAGSPAEINLKDRDIVNMRMAEWAEAPVLLVADIDRGGVFASIVGTLELLEPHERDRVKGLVINKFRGDVSLLRPGLEWLERRTGKPVVGVVPHLDKHGLEDEDSLSLDNRERSAGNAEAEPGVLDIAALRLPFISNFTDFDPLHAEPDVRVRYVNDPAQLGHPDAVVIPGSKNTVSDLDFLRDSGLAGALERYRQQGGTVVGLCGGYEMMGRALLDPAGVESNRPEAYGLGWLPFSVVFALQKRTVRVAGSAALPGMGATYPVSGYEIHMGEVVFEGDCLKPFVLAEADTSGARGSRYAEGAASPDGRVWGTFLHGVFHNDDFRRGWLNRLREAKGLRPIEDGCRFGERREAAFDRLAGHVRAHLDMDFVYRLLGSGGRADGPAVP